MKYAEIESIGGRHFVCHLGICNPICVKLLQLMCGVIMHNSVKNEVFIICITDLKPIGSTNYITKYADDSSLLVP